MIDGLSYCIKRFLAGFVRYAMRIRLFVPDPAHLITGPVEIIQVVVDKDHIKSASIVNLDESVAAMYPLLTTSMDAISAQLAAGVSIDDIRYESSSRYTSQVLLSAIAQAIDKAR